MGDNVIQFPTERFKGSGVPSDPGEIELAIKKNRMMLIDEFVNLNMSMLANRIAVNGFDMETPVARKKFVLISEFLRSHLYSEVGIITPLVDVLNQHVAFVSEEIEGILFEDIDDYDEDDYEGPPPPRKA
jgi:hypothetical protein